MDPGDVVVRSAMLRRFAPPRAASRTRARATHGSLLSRSPSDQPHSLSGCADLKISVALVIERSAAHSPRGGTSSATATCAYSVIDNHRIDNSPTFCGQSSNRRKDRIREHFGTGEARLGPSGIRAVQVLLASPHDGWTVNRLAERAEISVGQAHNVLRAVEQQRLVHTVGKGPKQRRLIDDPRAALDWLAVVDGARRRSPAAATYLYARTEAEVARRFAERAAEAGVAYAVTGAAGSSLLGVPVLSRIVVTQIRVAGLQPSAALARLDLEDLGADEAGRGMNLEVWADLGEVGTFGASEMDGVRVAPPVRVWLDLLRQGGRNVDAAQLFREQALERA